MLKVQFIGTLGADAEKKTTEQGGKFTTARAAHNDTWTDDAGQEHTATTWVDLTLDDHPKVADFLKRGQQVYVEGYVSLRVYSSPKDRVMKAGLTIRVRHIELLGGKVDAVPRQLIDETGVIHDVTKFYNVKDAKKTQLMDKNGRLFDVDKNGWVVPYVTEQPTNTENNEQ